MEKMLNPKSIAIVGASDKRDKIGNILIKNLINKKYKGLIFPINPRHKIIEGLKVSSSILEIRKRIDLVIIAIPASFVLLTIDDCIRKGVKNIIIISAGFSESGLEGQKREAELKKVAEENNLNIMGPNCLGFINTNKDINASFAKKEVSNGEIGLISQSGALVTGLLGLAEEESLGFSKIITLGNKTVLDEITFLEYLGKDPKTKIIGLYLENIKKGRLFHNAVARISKKKPILILKAGNSEKVKKAIMSHTGSMAGETDVIKKAFQDSGALYFENIINFWNTLKFFNNHKLLKNNKLIILTNAGGPGVIAANLIEQKNNLDFYDFTKEEKKSIKNTLPSIASIENPIDILGDASSERYEKSLKELLKIKNIGAVIVLITPQAQTDVKKILKVIEKKESEANFPIITVLIGPKTKNVFQFPEEVINVLGKVEIYQQSKKIPKKIKTEPLGINILGSAKIRGLANKAKEEKRNVFYYEESLKLMRYYGINSLKAFTANKKFKISSIPGQLIMKVDDPSILHKMAKGGVRAGIRSRIEFDKALKQFQKRFKGKKIIIQSQVEKGTEIIIGLKKDSNFGPVLLCGIGGILTEIFNEKLLWILPTNKEEIRKNLKKSKISQIFKKEKLDLDSLVEEINKIGKIGWQNKWLKELDINPMFFYDNGKKPLAVDIKVKIDTD